MQLIIILLRIIALHTEKGLKFVFETLDTLIFFFKGDGKRSFLFAFWQKGGYMRHAKVIFLELYIL